MANQAQQLMLPTPRTYTRTDFAALRAFVQHIAPSVIAHRYYDPDDRDISPQAATADAMERFLRTMLDDLVQLALRNGSAALAAHLKASIKQHGSAKLTAVTLRMVEQASALAAASPATDHHVGLWLRPLVTKRLDGRAHHDVGRALRVLQCPRRQLVALGATHRRASRAGPGCLVASS